MSDNLDQSSGFFKFLVSQTVGVLVSILVGVLVGVAAFVFSKYLALDPDERKVVACGAAIVAFILILIFYKMFLWLIEEPKPTVPRAKGGVNKDRGYDW